MSSLLTAPTLKLRLKLCFKEAKTNCFDRYERLTPKLDLRKYSFTNKAT